MLAATGCHGWRGSNHYEARGNKEATYAFGEPGSGWRPLRKDVPDVQVAWLNPELVGMIELHGQCEDQGDSSLEQYTDHLRIDWTEWNVIEQEQTRLAGRDALRTVVTAELDGVPRKMEMWVVKKNGCLFDLRYSTDPETFTRGLDDFRKVVQNFRFPVTA